MQYFPPHPNSVHFSDHFLEDFSNQKTPNAKHAILKNAINHSGVLYFF